MKTLSQNIKKISVVTGLFLGAFVLSAFAEEWKPATVAAPGGNTGAPINVTDKAQAKIGTFAIGQKDPMPISEGLSFKVLGVAELGALFVKGGGRFLGDVGIGTDSPTKRLEVVGGPIKATGGLIIETVSSDPVSPETGRMWLVIP